MTILYNLALIYEERGNHDLAESIYNAILEEFPKYIDSILRLGCILRDRGDEDAALKKFELALEVDPNCADACILQANIHLGRRAWSLAQKQFERVMGMPNQKNDAYALLSMGNIFMNNLGEKLRYAKNMTLSEGYYKKTMQLQPRNIYAANGLGIMMAEKGNFELAKLIFSQVREASPDMPDAWINLAHIYVAEERYAEAIQLYSVCLSKCYNGQDLEVLLYLAKAYYESKNYPKCITALSRGIHLRPNDLRLWYNLALAQEDYAVATLGQESALPGTRAGGGQRTMADVQRAIADLKRAQETFQNLLKHVETATQNKKGGSIPFDKDKAAEHERFCADTLTKASYHLEFERQKEEKLQLESEARRKMLQEYEDRIAREKDLERLREEEQRKHREDVLTKQNERLQKLSQGWKQREKEEEEKKTTKKKGGAGGAAGSRKRKKSEDDEGFIDNGSDDEDGGAGMSIDDMKNRNSKLKKLADKRQKREHGGSDDEDDDEDNGTASVEANDLFGSDSSDDEADIPAAKSKSAGKTVNSDDEDGDAKPDAGNDSRQAEKEELFGSSSDEE